MAFKPLIIFSFIVLLSSGLAKVARAEELSHDSASPTELTIPQPVSGTNDLYNYIVDILTKALDVTASKFGPVTLLAVDEAAMQTSQLRDLEQQQLDITWSVTTAQREQRHQAIFIPITNGLFGQRVLLIREDETRFDAPGSEASLKRLRYVQGHDWPDAHIYRANGYQVVESTYRGAFTMLSEGFVDAFPRGILEIHQELAARDNARFKIERHVLFQYPSAMFFFVPKNKRMLAVRLEEGLTNLYQTGELQRHLAKQPFYQSALETMQNRMVYHLANPLLSKRATQALNKYQFSDEQPNVDGQ
ncbi:amino acid ABC transporter substrate-binding protein [Alteromonas ponticola]|uniref:Amino acid ABC transporter substrate-binding protein n=1 Tax=Alteromonas ponticola TaxID=2720613 RepID=A0ABX1R4N6_9ALTE|nr:amino acid ABC transporter substrate-binding protein [Alteromonas ponticola]NMH61383.1 amino acid ABC transporter substrate-binding protein [Alteromonas ponticola]